MHIEVVTPEGSKLSADVTEATIPGVLGEMGILPGHVPVLTVLDIGLMTLVVDDGARQKLAVNGGYLEVSEDTLIVMTETAEFASEIDVDRAKASIDRADKALAEMETGSAQYEAKLRSRRRNENRIAIAAS